MERLVVEARLAKRFEVDAVITEKLFVPVAFVK